MKLMNASILSCLLLTGCGAAGALEAPEIATKPVKPRVVRECVTDSPSWEQVPERRLTFEEMNDVWDRNRRKFEDMAADRRICKAGLKARGA